MDTHDLAINHGSIVNADGTTAANIGVRNGQIVTLTESELTADRIIDAAGKWVLPGVIDAHVHFALRQGQGEETTHTLDDYESGPRAAAAGGVTAFIDYLIPPRTMAPCEYIEQRKQMAAAGSCIDYGFHIGIINPDMISGEDLRGLVEIGVPSFKFFLTYRDWGFYVDRGALLELMGNLREMGGVVCVHAEDDEIIQAQITKLAGQEDLINFSRSHPEISEEIAVMNMVALAKETGAYLYIVHLSTSRGLEVIRRAQSDGVKVRTETCPHYLSFSDRVYYLPEGALYTMMPPLRPEGNQKQLWEGIKDGTISIISSDHNALSGEIKRSSPDWRSIPPGLAGSEMLLTAVHTEGVASGIIHPEKMVELLSANPARLFGVPDKGSIRIGFDADIVIFDPREKRTLVHTDLATQVDYSIFEGREMIGWPTHTISRGRVVFEHGKYVGQKGTGRFIERRIDFEENW